MVADLIEALTASIRVAIIDDGRPTAVVAWTDRHGIDRLLAAVPLTELADADGQPIDPEATTAMLRTQLAGAPDDLSDLDQP